MPGQGGGEQDAAQVERLTAARETARSNSLRIFAVNYFSPGCANGVRRRRRRAMRSTRGSRSKRGSSSCSCKRPIASGGLRWRAGGRRGSIATWRPSIGGWRRSMRTSTRQRSRRRRTRGPEPSLGSMRDCARSDYSCDDRLSARQTQHLIDIGHLLSHLAEPGAARALLGVDLAPAAEIDDGRGWGCVLSPGARRMRVADSRRQRRAPCRKVAPVTMSAPMTSIVLC